MKTALSTLITVFKSTEVCLHHRSMRYSDDPHRSMMKTLFSGLKNTVVKDDNLYF